MGKLERKLDLALIERMSNGSQAKPEQSPQAKRVLRQQVRPNELAGRSNLTYRGARRNNGTHLSVDTKNGLFDGPIQPNRRNRPSDGNGGEHGVRTSKSSSTRGVLFEPSSSPDVTSGEAETGGTDRE